MTAAERGTAPLSRPPPRPHFVLSAASPLVAPLLAAPPHPAAASLLYLSLLRLWISIGPSILHPAYSTILQAPRSALPRRPPAVNTSVAQRIVAETASSQSNSSHAAPALVSATGPSSSSTTRQLLPRSRRVAIGVVDAPWDADGSLCVPLHILRRTSTPSRWSKLSLPKANVNALADLCSAEDRPAASSSFPLGERDGFLSAR